MKVDNLDPPPAIGTADLSFRSIKGAAARIISLVSEKMLIALIKPQFEIDRTDSDFKGIVTDTEKLKDILYTVAEELEDEKVYIKDIIRSPIEGKKGNREFLALLTDSKTSELSLIKNKIDIIVN